MLTSLDHQPLKLPRNLRLAAAARPICRRLFCASWDHLSRHHPAEEMYRWPTAGELAMDDDGCSSWLLPAFQQGGDAASCCGSELQQEPQDLPISYQVEEQLQQQIYLLMGMEEAPSSQSSAFRSFSGSPPDEASSLIMPGSYSTNSRGRTPEVSPVTFGGGAGHYGQCYYYGNDLDSTIPNLEGFTYQQQAHRHERERGGAGAFVPYSRHLSTKKKPNKPPGSGGGQRAIKAAMSALARMHTVRLAQWRQCCYQMEMAAAVAPPHAGSNSCNNDKLQHVMSERKRREKLNDSFNALKTVLPPAPKIDKASILTTARDYVNTLKSRVSELEERNRMLLEFLGHHNNGDPDDVSGEEIQVSIDRATAEEIPSQEVYLRIVVRSGCSAMDAVVGVLECLKEIGDVRLAAMDTGNRSTTLTLQMKTSGCDDNFVKESVIKSVKGVMQSKTETS